MSEVIKTPQGEPMASLRVNVERAFRGFFVPPHRVDQLLEEIRDSEWLAQIQQRTVVETLREAAEGWGDGAEGFPYVWLLDRAAEAEEGKIPDWNAKW